MGNKFINKDELNNSNQENNNIGPHSEYSDHIYVEKGRGEEDLYDRNNPIVKMILLVVGGVAGVGTIFYLLSALGVL